MEWKDGLLHLFNLLANRRNPHFGNKLISYKPTYAELNEIYKLGIGSKIVRTKTSYALKSNSMIFDSEDDEVFYLNNLHMKVKEAFTWALVFGRGILVINDKKDLSLPLGEVDKERVKFDVFSGDIVSVLDYELDLNSERFMRPNYYNVRGVNIHHTRVIDFTYVKPTLIDAPSYNLGGISEFELIYNQLINDGIVERAGASIIEKNSSLFYKIKGFKQALQAKQEESIVKFYKYLEDNRSIYGAGLLDSDDDVVSVSQALTNLSEVDTISLRRLAMVTGIPLALLVGENVKGLNSTGEHEKTIFNEMIENLQNDYILTPLNRLMQKLGLGRIRFKEHQNITPTEKAEYESKVIDNALKLDELGFDVEKYLEERGVKVILKDEFENEFPEPDEE